jgi:hypothetical protein
MTETLIRTDKQSRVTLPGHPNQQFLVRENGDGSLVLEPAVVVTAAQYAYDTDPELQGILRQAMTSPNSTRPAPRPRR